MADGLRPARGREEGVRPAQADRQSDRALRYIDAVGAAHVFPTAGPPCFLDEDLFHLNGLGVDGESIFTDQTQFLDELRDARPAVSAHLLLPGSVAEFDGPHCELTHRHSDDEIRRIFEDKTAYLRELQQRKQPELQRERDSRSPVPDDLLAQLKDWWEPLMKRADSICEGVGGPVRLDVGDRAVVVDFTAREVRNYAGETVRYRLSTAADLIATNLARREVDWSNSLFLSCRFTATRVGQYNEYVYIFFKCLSEDASTTSRTGTTNRTTTARTSSSTAGACSGAAPTCAPTSPSSAASRTAC